MGNWTRSDPTEEEIGAWAHRVREHVRAGGVLPVEMRLRFGITQEVLAGWQVPTECIAAMEGFEPVS